MSGVFPADPSALGVELLLDGTWTDVSRYALGRDDVLLTSGQANEARDADRSECSLSLKNGDGRFSSRNPMSPYYPDLGLNTGLRVSVLRPNSRLVLPENTGGGGGTDYIQAPDTAGLSITGDIDVRVEMRMDTWWSYLEWLLLDKTNGNSATQYSWGIWTVSPLGSAFVPYPTGMVGRLVFVWSTDGTDAGKVAAVSTAPVPLTGRFTVRVTLDVNNGAGGWTATFYLGSSVDGPWTQLGDAVTGTGVTSIFDSTSPLRVRPLLRAEAYAVKVLSGIAGTERANPNFTTQADGAASFADPAGNTWTVNGAARLSRRYYRFAGEVASWPQRWEQAGADAWSPVEAFGILNRLGTGATPLKSSLFRGLVARPDMVAYWPAEDGTDSTQIASGIGGPAMVVTGSPSYAATTIAAGSEDLPTINSSRWAGSIPTYTGTGEIELRFLMRVPAAGATNGAIIARLGCTGTAVRWDLKYSAGGTGSLRLLAFDSAGATLADSGDVNCHLNGATRALVTLRLDQDGADVDWEFWAGLPDANWGTTGTLAGKTVSAATSVQIDPTSNLTDVVLGQISVESAITTSGSIEVQLTKQVDGWAGEPAAARISRLCSEEEVPVRVLGFADLTSSALIGSSWDENPTEPMGAQKPATLLELVRECADTDGGILGETPDDIGLLYRPRESLYNQTAALALDFSSSGLAGLKPIDDIQMVTRNDVTVRRRDGSSDRQTLDTGRLSVGAIGRIETGIPVNTKTDAVLPNHAGWWLHRLTVDESRFPAITLNLARLLQAAAAVDLQLGDRITIDNTPTGWPPDLISQLVLGFQERLNASLWTLQLQAVPESPWQVLVWDDPDDYWDSDGSTLAAGVNTTATSLSVATPSGPLWSHSDGNFDIRVSGERLTVTNVTGASSPQTFTVTRSVNGVIKSLPTAAEVELWRPAVYGL